MCIIKLGGAAITHKHLLEQVNSQVLNDTANHLFKAFDNGSKSRLIVVHGAGGFGHQLANKFKVVAGPLHVSSVRTGFVRTR